MADPRPAGEPVNPAVAADAQQHAREEVAGLETGLVRRLRYGARWLAVGAGAVAGWLVTRKRPRA